MDTLNKILEAHARWQERGNTGTYEVTVTNTEKYEELRKHLWSTYKSTDLMYHSNDNYTIIRTTGGPISIGHRPSNQKITFNNLPPHTQFNYTLPPSHVFGTWVQPEKKCEHKFVNVGFMHEKWVCKHCDTEK